MIFAHLKIAELQYIYFFLSLVRWVITLAEDIFNLLALYQSSNQKNRNPFETHQTPPIVMCTLFTCIVHQLWRG